MTSIELAGAALANRPEGPRMIVAVLQQAFHALGRRLGPDTQADDALAGSTFLQQEPDLAKEAGIAQTTTAL